MVAFMRTLSSTAPRGVLKLRRKATGSRHYVGHLMADLDVAAQELLPRFLYVVMADVASLEASDAQGTRGQAPRRRDR